MPGKEKRKTSVPGFVLTPQTRSPLLRLQVTYRVVQVTDDQLEATADGAGAVSVVSTAAFAGAPQAVAQVSKHAV